MSSKKTETANNAKVNESAKVNENINKIVTVDETTETANNALTNESVETILSLSEVKTLLITNGIIPKFTDNVHYVGIGTRSNIFSVNVLKKQYNIYCNNDTFDTVKNANIDGVKCTENANASDKTRPNTITVKIGKLTDVINVVKPILPQNCIC